MKDVLIDEKALLEEREKVSELEKKAAEKKKKRKKKRRIIVLFFLLLLFLLVLGGILVRKQKKNRTEGQEVRIELKEGETLVTGTLTSVIGNDIAVQIADSNETKEYRIPVGTDVITRFGTTTTFSRLSAANTVSIVLESGTENILKIYIR